MHLLLFTGVFIRTRNCRGWSATHAI